MLREIWAALKYHCGYDSNYYLTWYAKAFYTFKVIICILFKWEADKPRNEDDYIMVGILESGKGFTGECIQYWWTVLVVCPGIKNWKYGISNDASC